MMTIVRVACGLLLLCQLAACNKVPPFFDDLLKRCDVKDQDSMDSCLYLVLDSMRPYLHDGIPEWSIPCLEPLAIQAITLNQGGGNTRIRATFKDLAVSGLSNYTISYVKSDPAQYKFSVGLQFPTLHIAGNYNILGNLLLIPIKGQGPFKAEFKSVTADSYNWLDVVHPAGPAAPGRLLLSHTQTDFDIGKVHLRLENLFNNDEFLGETVNTFLNENAQDIIREVKPHFAQEIDRLVLSVFSRAVAALPVELWEGLAKKLVDPTDPEQAKKLMALGSSSSTSSSSSKAHPKEDKKSTVEVQDSSTLSSAVKEDKITEQVQHAKHVKKQLEPAAVKDKGEPKKPDAVTFKDHSKVSA